MPPKKPPQLTAEQTEAVVRAYTLSGRLLHSLFAKLVGLMPDGRVPANRVPHAKFVARSVGQWIEKTLADVGLRVQIGLDVALFVGRAWDDTEGVEIEVVFPEVFSKIIVDAVLKKYTICSGMEHRTGHLDSYDYARVMRDMVTAEGCDETWRKRENDDTDETAGATPDGTD